MAPIIFCFLMMFTVGDVVGSLWSDILTNLESVQSPLKYSSVEPIGTKPYPKLANSKKLIKALDSAGEPCSSMFHCASCNTVQLCKPTQNGTYVPITNITCPKSTPYCSTQTGTCTGNPDEFCGQSDDFVCPGDGYFPDATNCSIYHACNNLQSSTFICGSSNYNPDEASCVFNGICHRANCSGISGKKISLGTSHYYAYCNGGKPEIIDRCPGNYRLNFTSQQCEPLCTENGVTRDYLNCTRYYKCSTVYINPNTSVFVRTHLSCTRGYAFDPSDHMCMPLNQTDCQQPHTNKPQ